MKSLLTKALNKNQLLILENVKNNTNLSITSLLERISREVKIPISTLKLNSKILRELDLIDFGNSHAAKLTESGQAILKIMGGLLC